MTLKPELISFKLCPFVQRAVILLLEKNIEFDIHYIELDNPPPWFRTISPLGKVPVLKAEGEVLFESAVICEYLDEVTPPSLHPARPVQKAMNRAWIEFASELTFAQFRYFTAQTAAGRDSECAQLRNKLELLEKQLDAPGPFFNGADFALVDAVFAPTLARMHVMQPYLAPSVLAGLEKLTRWQDALLARTSVQQSTVADFVALYLAFLRGKGSLLLAETQVK